MSKVCRSAIDFEAFTTAYREAQADGFADIDLIWRMCRKHKAFGPKARKAAMEAFEKDLIRRVLKSRLEDTEGVPLRSASIVVPDEKTGSMKRVYRQETLMDVGEFVQVYHYWESCEAKCKERQKYYRDLGIKLHGKELQRLLPFES